METSAPSSPPPATPDRPRAREPRVLGRILLATGALYALFLLSAGGGFYANRDGRHSRRDVDSGAIRAALENEDRLEQFLHILGNNSLAIASLLVFGGITLGLYSVSLAVYFGIEIGLQAGGLHAGGTPGRFLAAYFLPHGILEILALSVAGSTGLVAGLGFVRYLRGGALLVPGEARRLGSAAAVALGLVLAAALLEVLATPRICLPFLE